MSPYTNCNVLSKLVIVVLLAISHWRVSFANESVSGTRDGRNAVSPAFDENSLQASQLLDQLFSSWAESRTVVTSVCATYEGIVTTPAGFLQHPISNSAVPDTSHEWILSVEYIIDFANGRFYRRERGEVMHVDNHGAEWKPRYAEVFYDGKDVTRHKPTEMNRGVGSTSEFVTVNVSINPRNFTVAKIYDTPLFFSRGSIPKGALFEANDLSPQHEAAEFIVASTQVEGGKRVYIVRSRPEVSGGRFAEFHIEEGRGNIPYYYAIKRDDRVLQSVEVAYESAGIQARPIAWTALWFESSEIPEVYNVRLKSVEFNCPVTLSDFQMQPEPGMLVVDSSKGQMPFVKGTFEGEDRTLGEYQLEKQRNDAMTASSWSTLVLITVAVFVVVIAALWFHRLSA